MPSNRNTALSSICKRLKEKAENVAAVNPQCVRAKEVMGFSDLKLLTCAELIFDALNVDDQRMFDAHSTQAGTSFVEMWWGPGFPELKRRREEIPEEDRAAFRNGIRRKAHIDFHRGNVKKPKPLPDYFTVFESEEPLVDVPEDVQCNSGPTPGYMFSWLQNFYGENLTPCGAFATGSTTRLGFALADGFNEAAFNKQFCPFLYFLIVEELRGQLAEPMMTVLKIGCSLGRKSIAKTVQQYRSLPTDRALPWTARSGAAFVFEHIIKTDAQRRCVMYVCILPEAESTSTMPKADVLMASTPAEATCVACYRPAHDGRAPDLNAIENGESWELIRRNFENGLYSWQQGPA
jgi:hypothetical protein